MSVIDCQSHWYPRSFFEAHLGRDAYPRARKEGGGFVYERDAESAIPIGDAHVDLGRLLEQLHECGIDVVVSSPAALGVDALPAGEAREVAELLNEEQAGAERRYPGRYYGLATLPLADTDAALAVLDDALGRLGLRGVYLHSNVNGEPVDAERLRPVYARIAEWDVPIFLHPTRPVMAAALRRYGLEYLVGFVFDTTIAALNLVFGRILEEFPGLKVVHPHLGATIPFLAGRIDYEYSRPWVEGDRLPRQPSDYLRSFYADTAVRDPGALALALEFYGPERILFASDAPWWPAEDGLELVRSALAEPERSMVLGDNAKALLKL